MRYLLTFAVLVLALPAQGSEIEEACEIFGNIYGDYIVAGRV